MHPPTRRWMTGLAVVLFVIGSAVSLYWLLHRTDQELETRVFEVDVALDAYPMPFSEPEEVRCPPALSDGERGTVKLSVTNTDTALHTLALDYGECFVNLNGGEGVHTGCTVRATGVSGDFMRVHVQPVDLAYSIYSPRTVVCSIPIVNVGSLNGQAGLIVQFLPGVVLMLLGAGLWVVAGQAAHRSLRLLTIAGGVLVVALLLDMLVVALLTQVNLRAYLLIGLTAVATLLAALLLVEFIMLGAYEVWQSR